MPRDHTLGVYAEGRVRIVRPRPMNPVGRGGLTSDAVLPSREPPMTAPTISTHTLDVPGAIVTYDVRGTLGTGTPLLIFGSPMGADGFATLAGHFRDRPVVTYDPRGVG